MSRHLFVSIVLATISLSQSRELAAEIVVDFESFSLGAAGFFNGPVPGAVPEPSSSGGTNLTGLIDLDGVGFINRNNQTYGSWSGFAVSNQTDRTTPGFGNQYSAIPGSGAEGSSQYAVAFGYNDVNANLFDPAPFDRYDVDQLRPLPSIYLPSNTHAMSVQVTNTTYAALSMQDGDGFAKVFGGATGNDPDYFSLSVFGIDANNQVLAAEVDFSLADFSFSNNADDYILGNWANLDLSSLANANSLHFNLSSSDSGDFGMNTPSYFALDNLTLDTAAVPEPSSLAVILFCLLGGGVSRWRRRSSLATCER